MEKSKTEKQEHLPLFDKKWQMFWFERLKISGLSNPNFPVFGLKRVRIY